MKHPAVSSALTSLFKSAKVFENTNQYTRVCPSHIRASVATELAGIGDVNLEDMATVFMKHNENM